MINLLPPEEKKELLLEEEKKLTIILGLVVLLSLFCLIIILAFLKVYLLIQVDSQKNILESVSAEIERSEFQVIREKIEDTNQKLIRINDFHERELNSVELLEKLIQTIPKKVYLNSFSYSKSPSQITLAGFAPSRDLLVQFKENLEGKFEEEKVFFPPSVWNESFDINFAGVKITFDNEDLK